MNKLNVCLVACVVLGPQWPEWFRVPGGPRGSSFLAACILVVVQSTRVRLSPEETHVPLPVDLTGAK